MGAPSLHPVQDCLQARTGLLGVRDGIFTPGSDRLALDEDPVPIVDVPALRELPPPRVVVAEHPLPDRPLPADELRDKIHRLLRGAEETDPFDTPLSPGGAQRGPLWDQLADIRDLTGPLRLEGLD